MTRLFVSPQGEPFRAIKGGPSPVAQWFSRTDTDHDGRISRAEFLAESQAFFTRLDANGDGYVTSSEVTAMQAKQAPEILHAYGPLEDLVGPGEASQREQLAGDADLTQEERAAMVARPYGAQAYTWLDEIEPVMSDDADLNGKVSLKEFQAAALARFDRLDANHDGYFTLSEAPKAAWRLSGQKQ